MQQAKGQGRDMMTHVGALAAAREARFAEARRLWALAVDLAGQHGEWAATFEAAAAVREASYGNAPAARERAASATKMSARRDVQYAVALGLPSSLMVLPQAGTTLATPLHLSSRGPLIGFPRPDTRQPRRSRACRSTCGHHPRAIAFASSLILTAQLALTSGTRLGVYDITAPII
jgi:hypothetical protein